MGNRGCVERKMVVHLPFGSKLQSVNNGWRLEFLWPDNVKW